METLSTFISSLEGKSLSILGMGVSNQPLIRLLLDHNVPLSIRDKKPDPELQALFQAQGALFHTGAEYLDNLTEDILFRTPGLSPHTPQLQEALARGQHITSEMQEFFHLCPCPILAVTGSDGKTTTTTLIAKFLETTGKKVFLGGNIGTPLLCQVDEMSPEDVVVLELSSFQLMDLDCSPHVAVLTNLSPNHLDYHKDMEEYIQAKTNLFTKQTPEQTVIFNMDNESSMTLRPLAKGNIKCFSRSSSESHAQIKDQTIYLGETAYLPLEDIQLKGTHNVENYMAAILAVEDYCTPEQIQSVAKHFFGVEHRLQLVRSLHGVNYYNDSIATSPSRCIAGLRSFDKPVILILGGYDKGLPILPLMEVIVRRVTCLIYGGGSSNKINDALMQLEQKYHDIHCPEAEDIVLERAVRLVGSTMDYDSALESAQQYAKAGGNVLFSPAFASFDQFKNFMERGDCFIESVNRLK